MHSGVSSSGASGLRWQSQSAALLAWAFIVVLMLGYAVGIDRTYLIDQPNYVNNFFWDPTLQWTEDLNPGQLSLKGLVIGVFSEEVLWHVWTTSLGSLLEPTTAVVVTVCVLNLLIALSVVRLRDPVMPLLIWLVLPVGFAVTGLLLLREGLALAVMLYITLRLNRPVLGTLVAAMIHTTFLVMLPFAIIVWLCGHRRTRGLLLAVGLAFAAAYLGGMLFAAFGGRRVQTYDVNDPQTNSILYVVGALLYGLPSVFRLASGAAPGEPAAQSRTLTDLAVIHVAIITFVVTSYFIFPLGAGRVGFLTMYLLIPILPTTRQRASVTGMVIFSLLTVFLIYLAIKAYLEGWFDILFSG
jgi:hypothetical protein